MLRIRVPDGRDLAGYVGFGAQLAVAGSADDYVLDFGEVSFASPGWMVSVGDALRKFRRDREGSRRTAANYKGRPCLEYAARAGFFRSFGMSFGQPTGAVASTDSYIPVTVGEVDDIRTRAFEDFAHHGDVVQDDAERMVAVLTQSSEGPVFETLSYAIREIVRNVVEHSQSSTYSFAAQFWPANGTAEVVVSDEGVGIARTLRANSRNDVTDDAAALDLAVRPGVSSRDVKRRRPNDVWANSGYGLYMVRNLCRVGGSFTLASGSRALISTEAGDELVEADRDGTTVVARLATARIGDLGERLSEFRDRAHGERVAIRPSGASLSSRVARSAPAGDGGSE